MMHRLWAVESTFKRYNALLLPDSKAILAEGGASETEAKGAEKEKAPLGCRSLVTGLYKWFYSLYI